MRRFILTGTAGAGKTTLLRYLESSGYFVVEEAATDVIAREQANGVPEPWTAPVFITQILELQKQRQEQALSAPAEIQFFDRSPLDAYVLCKYLEFPVSPALLHEIETVQEAGKYEREVFFLENLGFCEPTAARRIRYEEALRFEQIHRDVYREWGYHCLNVPPQSVLERALVIETHLNQTEIRLLSEDFCPPATPNAP